MIGAIMFYRALQIISTGYCSSQLAQIQPVRPPAPRSDPKGVPRPPAQSANFSVSSCHTFFEACYQTMTSAWTGVKDVPLPWSQPVTGSARRALGPLSPGPSE